LTGERQTVSDPQTGEVLWAHETQQEYSAQGLANRLKPDGLPPVEWLTCGSGYLAGMKLGDRPLVEYTRDRLHREVQRRFGSGTDACEQSTAYNLSGQLQGRHLNHPQPDREYGYDNAGRLVRISGPQQTREYRYSEAGRLTGVHTTAANLDITLPYATDPAGNRLPDPEFYPQSSSTVWADNRITEDMQYRYRYDRYGRLTEKTDRIPEGVIRMHDERTHRYDYDNQHRLVRYVRTQYGETQAEGRYIYDPTGRRVGKRVWKREPVHWSETRTELSARPYETWYGWEGDRLATIRTQQRRVQTVYEPGSFTPLLRVETENTELAKTRHRGLPLALISPDNTVAWRAEYDEWGNLLSEENPEHLEQLIRLPGQQYDEESGLHYNRHRYYSPGQGRYITQDPTGLKGGWNPYQYPLNPIHKVDPLGLKTLILVGGATTGNPFGHAALAFSGHGVYSYGTNTKFGSKATDYLASQLSYRDTTLYELDTTPEQEKEMMQHIKENYSKIGDYSILHHDCATMVLDAMSTAGVSRDFIIYAIANGGKPAQLPTTVGYIGSILSGGNSVHYPQGAPLSPVLAHYNPGVGVGNEM
ncbi:DUF4105 domain-containing protein, partial [Salmonella enterica subsp. salamae]|nr:DUF4105 domain-containing protein [Salmonella enterica subsp. salamae]